MPFEVRWEDPADARYGWTLSHGGPRTRLYEDADRAYFEAMRRCYEITGSPIARDHIFRVIDGFFYYRAPKGDERQAAERRRRHQERAAGYIAREATYYFEELRPEVTGIVTRLRKHPPVTASLPTLVSHLEECVEAHAHVMGDLHWRMVFADPPFDWKSTFHELTGEPPSQAHVLLAGTANEMTKVIRRMRSLAQVARSEPELQRAVQAGDVKALERDTPSFRLFASGFRSLLRRYGLRTGQGWGSSVEITAPTWNMQPAIPLAMVATYARSDDDAVAGKEKAARAERQRTLRRIRRALRSDPGRLDGFEGARRRAIRNARVMEDHNFWMDQCAAGLLRESMDLVGRRLVRDGVIDDADDVLYLSLDELRSMARGDGPGDMRALVAERRRSFEERKRFEAPETIGGGPVEDGIKIHDEGEGLSGNVLHGVAASAGRYTGRARVCPPSPLLPELDEGDVLVATDAGPDWTPIFAILGAVVLDRGAAFQHAALMAREFGIPAVVGTKDGTSSIIDGQTITVDGAAGVVELRPG